MTRLTLRPYQEDCINALFSYLKHKEGNPLIVMPTASGKSLVCAQFILQAIGYWANVRVLVVTHIKELIKQNYDEFVQHWDNDYDQPAGINSAGMKRRDTNSQVLFAGVQSIVKDPVELGWFDFVIVDEAHRVPKKGMGQYQTYIAALKTINPDVRIIGLTATHYRLDGGYLHKGKDRIFDRVAYEVSLERLVPEYLSSLVVKQGTDLIDTSNVKIVAGEFSKSELEVAAMEVTRAAVAEAVRIGTEQGRKHWLAFAVTKKHASEIVFCMQQLGISCQFIFGDTPQVARDAIIEAYKAGAFTCLVNVNVLTTGFNAKLVDMLVVMKSILSTSLYVQIMGRGMRRSPGKLNCLVLDYGENVMRHGPVNNVKPKRGEGDGEAPCKVCVDCRTIVVVGVRKCPECGYEWPRLEIEIKQTRKASTAQVLDFTAGKIKFNKTQLKEKIKPDKNAPQTHAVHSMGVAWHMAKQHKPPTLKVTFYYGTKEISTYLGFEHGGFARRKAVAFWIQFAGTLCPNTVKEGLQRRMEIRKPATITLKKGAKKFSRIIHQTFPDEQDKTQEHPDTRDRPRRW